MSDCCAGTRFAERRSLCERWIVRAEFRVRALHDEILVTGDRVLAKLDASNDCDVRAAAE